MRTRLKILILALLLVALPSAGWCAVYYVDRNHSNAGDSNPGTSGQPWRTIQRAADTVKAGDTVYVKNGTYTEPIELKTSGSPGKHIAFRNYSGHHPIIDGSNSVEQKFIDWHGSPSAGTDKNYIIFDGFEVRNVAKWAFWVEGDHNIIRNCIIHDTGHTGIIAIDSDYLTISNNEIYSTGWNGLSLESGNYATVEYNISHNNPKHFGINLFPKTSWAQTMESGNDIRYNILYGNMGGIYTRYQKDNEIVGNLIYENAEYGIFLHNGAGGPTEYVARTKIYHNTVANNTKGGIYNVNATHLTIKNNIFAYHAIHDFRYELQMNKTRGHVIDYNLYYTEDSQKEVVYWGGPKYDLAGLRAATSHSDHGQFAKPLFKERYQGDYTLAAGSPAIDAGTNLGITKDVNGISRPQGGGYDLGACELAGGGGGNRPSPPSNLRILSNN